MVYTGLIKMSTAYRCDGCNLCYCEEEMNFAPAQKMYCNCCWFEMIEDNPPIQREDTV